MLPRSARYITHQSPPDRACRDIRWPAPAANPPGPSKVRNFRPTAAPGKPSVGRHVLRHTFGTELTRSGVDLVTVAELMGHASLETTRLYTRPSADDMQRAVDLLTVDE